METYVAYWKRGWWVWLMMVCINLAIALTAVPLAAVFHGNKTAYWTAVFIAWLVILLPLAGWVFELFARDSKRIVASEREGASPAA